VLVIGYRLARLTGLMLATVVELCEIEANSR
jgi:hypothetical protein